MVPLRMMAALVALRCCSGGSVPVQALRDQQQERGSGGTKRVPSATATAAQLPAQLPATAVLDSSSALAATAELLAPHSATYQQSQQQPHHQYQQAFQHLPARQLAAPPAGADVAADIKRLVYVGLYEGKTSAAAREAAYGEHIFSWKLVFQKIYELDYSQVAEVTAAGLYTVLNIEFLTGSTAPVLRPIADGDFDIQLHTFAQEVAKAGVPIVIRTLHEFNGDWYPWALLYEEEDTGAINTLKDFQDAWTRIIRIFRFHNAPVSFQLNYNANNGKEDPRPLAAFWPGDIGVESVAITCYNRAWSTPQHQESEAFFDNFAPAYMQVTKLTDLPIWVAETGTTSYFTDKPAWLKDAFVSIAARFPRVVQVTFFLVNKVNEGVLTDWDLNTPQEVKAFVEGYQTMNLITDPSTPPADVQAAIASAALVTAAAP